MKFVVYEVWTTARVIEAEHEEDAYEKGEPVADRADAAVAAGLNFSNWFVVPVPVNDISTGDADTRHEDGVRR